MPQQPRPPDLDQNLQPIGAGVKPPDLDVYGLPIYSEEPSKLGQAWKAISTPITTKPAEFAKGVSEYITTPTLATSPTGEGGIRDYLAEAYARMKGFGAGAIEGVGGLTSELTSPLNIALLGLTGGAGIAAKAGLPAIARLAKTGIRAVSAPYAVSGAGKVISPESTLAERGMGLAEMAGGLAGMKYPMGPQVRKTIITNPADIDAALKAGKINPEQATRLIEKYHADKKRFEATIAEPTTPIGPEVPSAIEARLASPERIQAAFTEGKISQSQAVRLLEKYYLKEAAGIKAKPTVPVVKPTAKVAPVSPETQLELPLAEILPKLPFEIETPPRVSLAEELLGKPPVAPVKAAPRDISESLDLSAPLRQKLPPEVAPTIPPSKAGVEEAITIPPVAPLTQLPTPPGLAQIIKAIPETGNAELDSAVRSFRAMRRRKGIDEFNDLEVQAYKQLSETIRNHPALPENLRARWAEAESTIPPTVEEVAKVSPGPVYVIKKDKATADFITKARKAGYEFLGLSNRGDYRFRKAPAKPGMLKALVTEEKGEVTISKKPEIGVPAEVHEGGIVVIKSGKASPDVVKKLFTEGFRFIDEDKAGNLRFKRAETVEAAPILEEEVGLKRPTRSEVKKAMLGDLGAIQDAQKSSAILEAFNLPRGLKASWDFSAPLRQGLPLIHKKAFWTSLKPMFESWASEEGFRASQSSIAKRPLFRKRIDQLGEELPSFADDAGLRLTDLTDLSKREEAIMSTWAEKVPMVRRSNRAYVSFLNNLRADVFESLIRDANILTGDPKKNLPLARSIADFVNTATGRGSLGKLESSAVILNTGLFAPRLIASRIKLLWPGYYIMAPPLVRKEALKSLFAVAAAGNMVLQLAKMMGAEVSTDPNSSDFGKAKIGNVRIDPWGGFQQYVVAANRLIRPSFAAVPGFEGGAETGITPIDLATGFLGAGGQKAVSSTTGREYDLWRPRGPYDPTHLTIAGRFLRGKLNPIVGFAYGILAGQKEMTGKPMDFTIMSPMENAIMQQFIPILMQDVYQLSQENPELLPLMIPATFGMGIQTYEQQR